jgi:hypothetical protein
LATRPRDFSGTGIGARIGLERAVEGKQFYQLAQSMSKEAGTSPRFSPSDPSTYANPPMAGQQLPVQSHPPTQQIRARSRAMHSSRIGLIQSSQPPKVRRER